MGGIVRIKAFKYCAGASALAFGLTSQAALANCDAILQDGVDQAVQFRSSESFDLAVYKEFLSSTYSSSKSSKSLGLGIPIGEQVMGTADYDEGDYNRKKALISDIMSSRLRQTRTIDFALSSGDEVIADRWLACKLKSGGFLSISMRRPSATEAVVTLEWHSGNSTINQTVLLDDIYAGEGNTITQSERCTKAGYVLANGRPCTVRIRLPDAEADLLMVANTENGAQEAYLPPKMKIVRDVQAYRFLKCEGGPTLSSNGQAQLRWGRGCPFRLVGAAKRAAFNHSRTVNLDQALIDEGWSFDGASFNMQLGKVYGKGGKNCTNPVVDRLEHQITYGYTADSRSGDRNASVICFATPMVNIERYRLVPAD